MDPLLRELLGQLDFHLGTIERCLRRLPGEAIWRRLRPGTNSVGNLCLHLAGNESHYIGKVLAESGYQRRRSAEFTVEGGKNARELTGALREARVGTRELLARLGPNDFDRSVDSNYPENPTVLRVILHVADHYAYHTGQIVHLTRVLQGGEERVLPWGH